MVLDVTLLTEEQIWGDEEGKGQLQVLKSYGTKTGLSDLAIVLGGAIGGSSKTSDNQRSGFVWSASSAGDGHVRYVRFGGDRGSCRPDGRLLAARPALPSSVASSIKTSEASLTRKISGVDVVEFGEYPQTIADETITRELEQAFSRNQLQKTGKTYTFDNARKDAYDTPFSAESHAEYQHKGKRYIRVEARPYDNDSVLSNGTRPRTGNSCWIEVQPIEWLKDPSGALVARQGLFAGVRQFDRKKRYDGNFENTDMKQYLQNHFAKEMQVSKERVQEVPDNVVSDVEDIERQREAALKNGQGM